MIFSGLPIIRNEEGKECSLPSSLLFYTSYEDLTDNQLSLLALYGILYHELIEEIESRYNSKDDVLSQEELKETVLSRIKNKTVFNFLRLNYIQVLLTNKNDPVYDHILNTHLLVIDLDVIPLNFI